MARRSDFAQKLLDDLRLRKERMAASQNTKGSNPMAADAYTYSKQTYRGTKEMKTRQTNGVRSGSMHNRSSAGNRSLSIEEGPNQIVPFGRGRSSVQIGDLSMALAFALENGGKLRGMDSSNNSSMLGFLHQYGRISVEVGKMERNRVDRHHPSTSSFPTLSHLHIKEISRGAQKLNQILRACSNGLNFDSYSIEIGKELLKGAMDLEESLRMLVNLQEASEYMIRPQSKTRITLLDDDEDEDDKTVKTLENNQLARPRFSFDKPSRNSHYNQEVAKTDLRQTITALTYASESTNFNNVFSEQKSHLSSSKSKPEKGRIPNVIAKLMGLEEFPVNEGTKSTQKESSSRQKTEGIISKKSAEGSSTQERRTKDAVNSVPTLRKQKQKQAYHNQVRGNTYALQSEKNLATHHANFEVNSHDGKPPRKDVEGIQPMTSSNNANMNKSQTSTSQLNQSRGSRKDIQQKGRKQDNTKIREQTGKERGETKDMIPKHELQHMEAQARNGSEDTIILQRQVERNASMLKTEKRDANGHLSNNQPESPNDLGFQQPHKLHNFGPQDISHRAGESEQQGAKQNIQARRKKQSEEMNRSLTKHMHDTLKLQSRQPHINQATPSNRSSSESADATQSKLFPINRHKEDLVQCRIYSTHSMNRNSNQNFSARDLKLDRKENTGIPQVMEEKHVHLPTTRKPTDTKVHKVESPRKINELLTRRNATQHDLARPQKNQTSILQDVNQQRRDKLGGSKEAEQVRGIRSKDAEAHIVKSNRSVASIQQSNLVGELKIKSEQASDFYCAPVDDECKNLKGPKIQAPNESHQSIISTVSNDRQGQILHLGRDEFKSHKIVMDPLNGTYQGSRDTANPSQLKDPKATKLETPDPLTESENQLKQILIKSQLFLNTAEALFKLNIPLGILHAGGHDCPNEESKLILDCGYELMKRKGKREELIINPLMTISVISSKARTLDDLIKQLHKNLKKLKSYGRNDDDYDDNVVEDYLPKMLESDVYNLDPDMNCMWDLGWNTMMFAIFEEDDVIRDVERLLLNLLLDEVTRDLLPVF